MSTATWPPDRGGAHSPGHALAKRTEPVELHTGNGGRGVMAPRVSGGSVRHRVGDNRLRFPQRGRNRFCSPRRAELEHVARGVYLRLLDDVELWVRCREFAPVAQQIATPRQALTLA